MKPNVQAIFDGLPKFLLRAEFATIETKRTGTDTSGNIYVDGKHCAVNIAVRSNGQCTISFLDLKANRKTINQYAFGNEQEAIATIASEIIAAMEFA